MTVFYVPAIHLQRKIRQLADHIQLIIYLVGFLRKAIGPVLHTSGNMEGLNLLLKKYGLLQISELVMYTGKVFKTIEDLKALQIKALIIEDRA